MRKLLLPCFMSMTLLTICLPSNAERKVKPSTKANTKLSSAPPAKPTPIYRCGTIYQATPCTAEPSGLQQKLALHDPRTLEQQRSAQQSAKQVKQQAHTIDKAQKKALAALARKPAKAIGLNCREPGSTPFETCGTQTAKSKSPKDVKNARKPRDERPKQGPFTSRAPD